MHTHARTFLFAGAACLGLFGAAFAATPKETAMMLVARNSSAGPHVRPVERPELTAVAAAQRIPHVDAVWPVADRDLGSPFGPRFQPEPTTGETVLALHRGIDIAAALGDEVVAVADGEVFGIYGPEDAGNPYPDAGTVVVLRHVADKDFMVRGRAVRRFYTIYAHLDGALVPPPTEGPLNPIGKGNVIGLVGRDEKRDGDARGALHLEVRVGAPDGPAIDPLRILPYRDRDEIDAKILSIDPLAVRVAVPHTEPDIAQLRVQLADGAFVADLAELPMEGVQVVPTAYGEGESYVRTFTFPGIRDAKSVLVRDIWGKGVRLTP